MRDWIQTIERVPEGGRIRFTPLTSGRLLPFAVEVCAGQCGVFSWDRAKATYALEIMHGEAVQ